MNTLTFQLHRVADGDLPDADLDVLIWDAESPEAQLGAFVGEGWVNTHGEAVEGVHTWAHMPSIRASVVEPSAWLHAYRQIGGGARYEEATVGDSKHCDHPPLKPGFKWVESRALYEDVTLRGDAPVPVGEARELGTVPAVAGRIGREPELVPLPNGRAVDLNGPWRW